MITTHRLILIALASFAAGCGAPHEPPPRLAAVAKATVQPTQPAPPAVVATPSQAPAAVPPPPAPPPEPVVEEATAELLASCREPRRIVIKKGARELELRCGEALAARYAISLGFAPAGHKHHEGDGRTPEGEYFITSKFFSDYHRSLQLSYPNNADAERGLAEGQINQSQYRKIRWANDHCRSPPQNTGLGSLLQIHGSGGGPEAGDWTLGCVAVDNPEIEAVFAFHQPGCHPDGKPRTPVLLLP